ncbi:hypothetical protein BGX28_000604 [Mortierella sp. GBA30]|nr:hypothetical protein BGX28_000604 [Mortierella sp. GBA30]
MSPAIIYIEDNGPSSPIHSTEFTEPADAIIFDREWCQKKTCAELMAWSGPLPVLISEVTLTDEEPDIICHPSDLYRLPQLPEEVALAQIGLESRDASKVWLLVGSVGIDIACLSLLSYVVTAVTIIKKLRTMDEWLRDSVRNFAPESEISFRELLKNCHWEYRFKSFGMLTRMGDVLLFAGKQWLNDGCVDAIFAFFKHKYGEHTHGRHLFIPLYQMWAWEECLHNPKAMMARGYIWGWQQQNIKAGRYRKAYAFVHMTNHWVYFLSTSRTMKSPLGTPSTWMLPNKQSRQSFAGWKNAWGLKKFVNGAKAPGSSTSESRRMLVPAVSLQRLRLNPISPVAMTAALVQNQPPTLGKLCYPEGTVLEEEAHREYHEYFSPPNSPNTIDWVQVGAGVWRERGKEEYTQDHSRSPTPDNQASGNQDNSGSTAEDQMPIDFDKEFADLDSDGCGSLRRYRCANDSGRRRCYRDDEDVDMDSSDGDRDWSDGDTTVRDDDSDTKDGDVASIDGDCHSSDGDFNCSDDDLDAEDGKVESRDGDGHSSDGNVDSRDGEGQISSPAQRWTPEKDYEFDSLDAARAWIQTWAAHIGFTVRTGRSELKAKLPWSKSCWL